MHDDVSEDTRTCEWPGCAFGAEHRAPRSRDMLREYRWFCLEHIRDYNRRWNYFEGMSEAEVEADLRRDTVWQRPTWPIGEGDPTESRGPKPGSGPFGIDPEHFNDAFGFFDDTAGEEKSKDVSANAETRVALATFGLDLPIDKDTLKGRYKELVKRYHPDTNGGTKEAEEKFKEIHLAYETLRRFLVI